MMTERFERAGDADVSEDYDVAALQRNLKALGHVRLPDRTP